MYKSTSFCRLRSATAFFVFILSAVLLTPVTGQAGFLYLLNDDSAGSRIYGFQVNETTGALTPLTGFPVNAMNGGINSIVSERMTIDVTNKRLYVINDSSDTVSAFSIDPSTGALSAMPFNPISLGTGAWNSIAVHPSGSPLIVANNALNGAVLSFVITPTSSTPATGSPFVMTGAAGFSNAFSKDGNYYYVGGNSGNNIAGFSVDSTTGVLTTLTGSPFNSGAAQPLAYDTDTAGRLYTVNSTNEVRAFTSASGDLTPVTGNPFPSGLTQRRFSRVHPSGNFLAVAGNTGNNVGMYQIAGSGAGTTVAPVIGSPFATGGTTANVLAFNAGGTYLFVGNRISRNVTTFSVNTNTGVLGAPVVQSANTMGTVGAINGIAYLPDPVVSNAQIGGRVTNAAGDGVGRVYVRLTNMSTMTATLALTNQLGYYNFPSNPTGAMYTITPIGKGYSFAPPSITFNHVGDATSQNFVATPN